MVSLVLASLRAQFNTSEHQNDEIIATDLGEDGCRINISDLIINIINTESAIPLLNHNIASNLSLCPDNAPKAAVLDWEDEDLPQSVKSLGNLDVVLYVPSSFPTRS